MATDYSVGFELDLANFKKSLNEVPGLTKKTARQMTNEWIAAWKANDAAAKDSAKAAAKAEAEKVKAAEDAAAKAQRAWEDQGKAAQKVGDIVSGGLVGDIGDLGAVFGSTGAKAAVAGGLFAAAGVGLMALGSQTHEFIGNADELIKRLDEIEGTEPLPAETLASLDEYRALSLEAEVASDRLKVVVAGLAAEVGGPLLQSFTETLEAMSEFSEKHGKTMVSTAEWIIWVMEGLETVTMAVPRAIYAVGDSIVDVAARGEGVIDNMQDFGLTLLGWSTSADEIAKSTPGAAAGLRDMALAAGLLRDAVDGASDLAALKEKYDAIADGTSAAQLAYRAEVVAIDLATQAQIDAAEAAGTATEEFVDNLRNEADALKGQAKAAADSADAEKRAADAKSKSTVASTEAAKAAKAQADAEKKKQDVINGTLAAERARAEAAADFAKTAKDAGSDLLTPQQELEAAYWEQVEAITEVADKTGEVQAAEIALAALRARFARDSAALAQAEADKRIALEAAIADATIDEYMRARDAKVAADIKLNQDLQASYVQLGASALAVMNEISDAAIEHAQKVVAAEKKKFTKIRDGYKKQKDAFEANQEDMSASQRAAAEAELETERNKLGAARDRYRTVRKIQREEMMDAFRAKQAADASSVVMNTAVAISQGYAQMGPIAGSISAAAMAIMGGVQLNAIRKEKPPKFHVGRQPDEIPATLTMNEGVANGRAMSDPAFRDELAARNAGVVGGSGGGDTVVMFNDRIIGVFKNRMDRLSGKRKVSGPKLGTRTRYSR